MVTRKIDALIAGMLCLGLGAFGAARAADDEIMVTDGDLAKPGKPELEVHANLSQGSTVSPGEGVFAPNHILRLTPEFSFGLSEHWDMGLYVPTSLVPGRGLYYDGIKARAKTIYTHDISDNAHLFYGLQFEVADLTPGAAADRTAVEVKAILGAEMGDWLASMNVVEQRDVPDHDLISPGIALSAKLERDLGHDMIVGLEHYASWSSTATEEPVREIDHITFLTAQWRVRGWTVHLGYGHGWAASPDKNVIKLVLGIPID